jgi:hypothetical protein
MFNYKMFRIEKKETTENKMEEKFWAGPTPLSEVCSA